MYKIVILSHFKKSLKPLLKKFPSLKNSVIETLDKFNKEKCTLIQNDLYKIRLKTKIVWN